MFKFLKNGHAPSLFRDTLKWLLCSGCALFVGHAVAQPTPGVSVAEARLVRGLSDRIVAEGTLRARESIDLTATVGERVTFVGFGDGERVKKGQVLLRLSSDEVEAMLAEAAAAADVARQRFERARELYEGGAGSLSQLDEARRESETANARKAALESRLSKLVITAPFDGVVGLRNISVGALVRPGDLITTLDDDSIMLLDFSLPGVFLGAVSPGTRILAKAPGFPEKNFEGVVRTLASRMDPLTRSFLARAEFPNPEHLLKPGLPITAELETNRRDAVFIPEIAIQPLGRENFVMVVEETPEGAFARRRKVELGARVRGEVEVVHGLNAGERVVTHGGFKLGDGAKVRITAPPLPEKAADGETPGERP